MRERAMIDPELQAAVDTFFASWKGKVEARLEMGEREYHGKWKEMTPSEVVAEFTDELSDMIAYLVFFNWKVGGRGS